MALKKALKRSENRVRGEFPAAYFRISRANLEENNRVRFVVHAYVDAAARKHDPIVVDRGPGAGENRTWISEKEYEVASAELPATEAVVASPTDALKASCYLWLKQKSEFATAEDC